MRSTRDATRRPAQAIVHLLKLGIGIGIGIGLAVALGGACTSSTSDRRPSADAGPARDGAVADAGVAPRVDAAGTDAGTPADAGALPDAATGTDAASPAGIDPSGGSGGAFPGRQTRTAPRGGVPYDLYIPTSYDPARAMPLVSLFHGQGDTGANMVAFWQATAESGGFIVVATTSTGSMGGWSGGPDVDRYDAALDDALAAYNVERARLYLWGFSAGAHLAHGIALANTELFAAYAVNAGVLDAFAGADAPAMAPRRIPVSITIGTTDPLYPYTMTDRMRFLAAGWTEPDTLRYATFDGPHTVLPTHPAEHWAFLQRFSL